jgi:hypothetical protein
MVVVTLLEDLLHKITKGILHDAKSTWESRFKIVWNESELIELLRFLNNQQGDNI